MFMVKKLLSACFAPLPLCLGVLAVGLALLWFTRRQRAGKILVSAAAALLLLGSYGGVADLFIAPLEGYRPVLVPGTPHPDDARARQARWIVVLGGGHTSVPSLPATSQLNPGTLARLVEGVRLKRQLPAARLVLSGGFGFPSRHADVVAAAAQLLGLRPEDLVLERHTFDTVDEARFIHQIVGADPMILVTAASHLPRATRLFRKEGMAPRPTPADFAALDTPGVSVGSFFPSAGPLARLEQATHEYLGLLFALLRGQI
jgi:uncharacterized SAM-binding protein YcdF (DUF218 family)